MKEQTASLYAQRLADKGYATLVFDAFRFIEMIAGTDAFSRPYSEKAVEKATGPSALFLIEGGTHMSLFDQDEHVTPDVDKLDEFYDKALAV